MGVEKEKDIYHCDYCGGQQVVGRSTQPPLGWFVLKAETSVVTSDTGVQANSTLTRYYCGAECSEMTLELLRTYEEKQREKAPLIKLKT